MGPHQTQFRSWIGTIATEPCHDGLSVVNSPCFGVTRWSVTNVLLDKVMFI